MNSQYQLFQDQSPYDNSDFTLRYQQYDAKLQRMLTDGIHSEKRHAIQAEFNELFHSGDPLAHYFVLRYKLEYQLRKFNRVTHAGLLPRLGKNFKRLINHIDLTAEEQPRALSFLLFATATLAHAYGNSLSALNYAHEYVTKAQFYLILSLSCLEQEDAILKKEIAKLFQLVHATRIPTDNSEGKYARYNTLTLAKVLDGSDVSQIDFYHVCNRTFISFLEKQFKPQQVKTYIVQIKQFINALNEQHNSTKPHHHLAVLDVSSSQFHVRFLHMQEKLQKMLDLSCVPYVLADKTDERIREAKALFHSWQDEDAMTRYFLVKYKNQYLQKSWFKNDDYKAYKLGKIGSRRLLKLLDRDLCTQPMALNLLTKALYHHNKSYHSSSEINVALTALQCALLYIVEEDQFLLSEVIDIFKQLGASCDLGRHANLIINEQVLPEDFLVGQFAQQKQILEKDLHLSLPELETLRKDFIAKHNQHVLFSHQSVTLFKPVSNSSTSEIEMLRAEIQQLELKLAEKKELLAQKEQSIVSGIKPPQ